MPEFVQEKVRISDLLEGMFVARLDRPWVGTPFPLQGFHVRNENDIRLLGAYCRYVYVDVVRSRVPVGVERRPAAVTAPAAPLNPEATHWPDSTRSFAREAPVVRRLHQDLARALDDVRAAIANGVPTSIAPARKVTRRVVRSMLRNPDAALWVARMQQHDHSTYARCVRSSIWAIAFGRHLGLSHDRLEHLALGVLLSEVGYTRLPPGLAGRKNPGPAEIGQMRAHVSHGLAILRDLMVHDEVMTTVGTHHERFDGSGYPAGLRGSRIPLCGQIAGLADVYDALTAPDRPEGPLAPDTAMAELHRMRDGAFGALLVDEFTRAIGIYPPGTLVELSSGETAVVIEQRAERRLRPRVLLLRDGDGATMAAPREIDLLARKHTDPARALDIVRSLPAGSCPLPEVPPARSLTGRLRDWLHR